MAEVKISDINWPISAGGDPRKYQHVTFTNWQMNNAEIAEAIIDTKLRMDWIDYEVDPEWASFCSFDHRDIGSVWEDLGVIRKRPPSILEIIRQQMITIADKRIEKCFLAGISRVTKWPHYSI